MLYRAWRIFAILFVLWLPSAMLAQMHNIDSIQAGIDTLANDSLKIRAYLGSFRSLVFSQGEDAMAMVSKGLELAKKNHDRSDEAESYRFQGVYYMINGASQLALEHYEQAFVIFQQLGNQSAILKTSNNFATVYMELEEYDSALQVLNDIKGFVPGNVGDTVMYCTMLHNKAICLDMMGRPKEAYALFLSNLNIFQKAKVEYEVSMTQNSLGEVLNKLHQPQAAIDYLRQAEALKQKLGEQRGLSLVLTNLANAYQLLHQNDSALAIGQRAIAVAEAAEAVDAASNAYLIVAGIHADMGQFNPAYMALKHHITLQDSAHKASAQSQIRGLQAAYGLHQKNDEIRQLQQLQDQDRQNLAFQETMIFALTAAMALVLLVLILLYRASKARKRLHEEVASKNDALITANDALQHSLQEREALLHMIIHDLKSPLAITDALVSAMLDIEGMPAIALQISEKVKAANSRGMELVSDLLALYEVEQMAEVAFAPVDCASLLQAVQATMAPYATNKGISLHIQASADMPIVQTNASMLQRVLENITSNAIKFAPLHTRVQLAMSREGDHIRFSIQDEGPGISAEDQLRLFQKFSKLSARPTAGEQSNGLGLAIVKQLTERLGGRAGVVSTLGHGAEFWVMVPIGK